jgi:hypothetical protein
MTIEEIEDAIERLPPEDLAKFRAWFETFEAGRFDAQGFYSATQEELCGVERGLRDAAEGKFASADEVEATFAKYRNP